MTGQDLVDELRETYLDDKVVPYNWSDIELLKYCNRAEKQACRRAYLIIDSTTPTDGTSGTSGNPICQLTIVPNIALYNLSPLVLQVERVKLDSMAYPLRARTRDELDACTFQWGLASGTSGTAGTAGGDPVCFPEWFVHEVGKELILARTPTINDTVRLIVSRLPLVDFTFGTSPEVEEHHHDGLPLWAAHLAFQKPDSDTQDIALAASYDKAFTERFGPMPDAYMEKMRKMLPRQQRMRPREFGS
jgi:hypothetical protein